MIINQNFNNEEHFVRIVHHNQTKSTLNRLVNRVHFSNLKLLRQEFISQNCVKMNGLTCRFTISSLLAEKLQIESNVLYMLVALHQQHEFKIKFHGKCFQQFKMFTCFYAQFYILRLIELLYLLVKMQKFYCSCHINLACMYVVY